MFRTDDPELLEELASFETLRPIKGFRAMKLFKATRKQLGEVTAILIPPAVAIHRKRADHTEALHVTCNLAVFSKVTEAAPARANGARMSVSAELIGRPSFTCACVVCAVREPSSNGGPPGGLEIRPRIRGILCGIRDSPAQARSRAAGRLEGGEGRLPMPAVSHDLANNEEGLRFVEQSGAGGGPGGAGKEDLRESGGVGGCVGCVVGMEQWGGVASIDERGGE
eukprot:1950276-Pleurochrysis_carterae.AAC.1